MLTFEGVEYKSWTVTAMREKRYKKNVLKRRCVDPCSQCKQYFSIGDPVVECGG